MAKTKISEWSTTPASNTDIDGINIAEGCAPSGINDAIRDLMAQVRSWQSGASGDPFNGPMNGTIGATTAYSGAFTTLSASSTVSGTGFSTYLASPPAIGGTAAAAVSATTLTASSTLTVTGAGSIQGLTVGRGAGAVATNVALGTDALAQNSTGAFSTVVGREAGFSTLTSSYNTFIGYRAGYNTTGDQNTFLGKFAGNAITSGATNTIVGAYNGNQASLDIRTASNYTVISDGGGTPHLAAYAGGTVALQGAVPVAGTGITFPATQNASSNANTLDDYEEGTWTPNQGGGLTVVGAFSSAGSYTKVGNLVTVWGRVTGATSISVGSIGVITTNLPFALGASLGTVGIATGIWSSANSATFISIGATSTVYSAQAISGTSDIYFTNTYRV